MIFLLVHDRTLPYYVYYPYYTLLLTLEVFYMRCPEVCTRVRAAARGGRVGATDACRGKASPSVWSREPGGLAEIRTRTRTTAGNLIKLNLILSLGLAIPAFPGRQVVPFCLVHISCARQYEVR
jgi:hypothetical protein